jgi:hypothetical protein
MLIKNATVITDYLNNKGNARFHKTDITTKNITNEGTALFMDGKIETNTIKNK